MRRSWFLFLPFALCACAGPRFVDPWRPAASQAPAQSWSPPAAPQAPREPKEEALAPEVTVLPIGVGLTAGPKTTQFGAAVDFPLDRQLTFGPAVRFGFDNNVNILSAVGQLKYYIASWGREGGFSVRPYATAGVGFAHVDKKGRSADTGLIINGGLGMRYLTGDQYRLGSEVRLNYLPDDVGGEDAFFAFELLHVVISF